MTIHAQTNLRIRPSHRTLLTVLYSEGRFRTQTGAAETAFRTLAESVIMNRLAKGPDPGIATLLAALNAAAAEAQPFVIYGRTWYRIAEDGSTLERWSIEQQTYMPLPAPGSVILGSRRRSL